MIQLIFVFLWFALAVIFESVVGTSKHIPNLYKKILYIFVTLPTIWLSWIKTFVVHIIPLRLAEKILNFFLS